MKNILKIGGLLTALLLISALDANAANTILVLPAVPVPEPATALLLGVGLVALGLKRKRR